MSKNVHVLLLKSVVLIGMCFFSHTLRAQIIGFGSNWHYLDNGTDQGTAWKDVAFDDAAWPDGNAALGYPAGGTISTVTSFGSDPNNKFITTYFRKHFTIADISQIQYVKLTLKRDDGAVIFINGNEVVRSNMPAGAYSFQTLAPANENATVVYTIPAAAFVHGDNLIAVEIHQTALTSSDILFDLSLENVTDQFVIGAGTAWKYLDNGTDQGTAWTGSSFNDASWQTGLAPLGYVMTGVLTTVSFGSNTNAKYPTTYFRKKVTVSAASLNVIDSVKITMTIDDGAIVYLNGTEILRRNMPAGAVGYTTLANATVGSAPSAFTITLPKSALVVGDNYFAVEIHQVTASSSDIYFDLSATPVVNDVAGIPSGSGWQYNDAGTALTSDWNTVAFNDASWLSGSAPLGYGNGDEATTVSFGANPAAKHITTYFRKHFTIASVSGFGNVKIQIKRDDAARIFLNGQDIYRSNLAGGTVDFNTTALTPIEGADENAWITINVPVSALVVGDNVIAVEVHKFNATESDLRFDLKLDLQQATQTPTMIAPNVVCDPSTNDAIGCFTSVKPTAQTQGIVIPPTHTFQLIMKAGTNGFYSNSTRAVPINNDFTGYIPSNGSSRVGTVSINHENDPGDVSLVNVHFVEDTKTWAVDSARLVDFAPLVRTTRNCSGGVTPWGTVVTSEETYTTGDVNGDGYHDRGWQVEIDPVSGRIVDHDNNGSPDKIWAMGRMNHENICIGKDSLVAYEAEDGGTSGVYKYVMDQKGKLAAGTLYVLKRDTPTSTTGTWVQVPNTTVAERNTVSTVITSLGGTNWSGPEDIEFGPDGKMYFTSKGTGTIWRFQDDGTTVSGIEAWVTNTNYSITHTEGTAAESWGTGIDNLTFDNEGNLWAQQDGGRGHLWVVRPEHTPTTPKVDLFCVTPAGSEPTGLTFTPDGRYGFLSFQHPSGTATVVDAKNQNVIFNNATTVVFARKEFLGAMAVEPRFELGADINACDQVVITANTQNDVLNIWQDNSVNDQLVVTQTGWYKATAYANNGRTYQDSIYVNITPTPAAPALTATTACSGTPLADLSATGNNITWYTDAALTNTAGTGAALATGQTAVGTYTYYATQALNGCVSDPASTTVTIHNLPIAPVTTSAAVCAESTVPDIHATGTAIQWYSDAALTNVAGTGNTLATGQTTAGVYTYYATQTNGNGCAGPAAQATLNIRALPEAPVTSSETVCAGQQAPALYATGSNIRWYEDAALTNQLITGNSFPIGETFPGIYTYYATRTDAFSCESHAAPSVLTVNALPGLPIGTEDVATCDGASVPDLTATGTDIRWYNDVALTTQVGTGNVFATGQAFVGTYVYYLTQTNANGCTGPAETVILHIYPIPALPMISGANDYCAGETPTALTATGQDIMWYDDATLTNPIGTGNTIIPGSSVTATYYATQTVNGCSSSSNAETVTIHALPTVSIAPIETSYADNHGTVALAGTPSGGNFSGTGVNGNLFNPAQAGVGGPYTITYTYTDPATGCENSTNIQVSVTSTVGLVVLENGNQYQVFPNPASEVMNVKLTLSGAYEVGASLYDQAGRLITVQSPKMLTSGIHTITIDRSELNLSTGTYWLSMLIDGQESRFKVIFQ